MDEYTSESSSPITRFPVPMFLPMSKEDGLKISVQGFVTSMIPAVDIGNGLTSHFSSCGRICNLDIPRDPITNVVNSKCSFFQLCGGEGAEEKALALDGTDMGGWNVTVKVLPHDDLEFTTDQLAAMSISHFKKTRSEGVSVRGYDNSLPSNDIKSALTKHFASCGEITDVFVLKRRRQQSSTEPDQYDVESLDHKVHNKHVSSSETEELVTFQGGEDLTICDILDAPGEVIGKSSYGTLYKASLQRSGKVRVLRFLRPVCTVRCDAKEYSDVIETLGFVRHENLVPLLGFYGGNRGEKLMVHPFFSSGNLSDFIKSGGDESIKWSNILSITTGISEALDHLHTGTQKPIVHGNLKSKNVFLNSNFEPRISDYGLHLLLNQTAGQEILDVSAAEGYKAPELVKMKEASKESDVYSLGVIMLELVSSKEAINKGDDHKLYRPEILASNGCEDQSEEGLLKYFQLAISCCSPSPSLRPNTKQVLSKLQDI
ncbi:unnamed protein product [Brassica rapa]|uniref:Protein kinase domain-containing protein n=1 Tax=Brassica campestris TaxID=3711 RepID=A0A3P5ZUV1_BRACM|nr:unnamed protein product [Brassica rapa]VDC78473.1 unnamed protein product [Brassica rapa]